MENVRFLELRPIDGRISFYGKARIYKHAVTGDWYLVSYDTIVCSYNPNSKAFWRFWDGYSLTTSRHINAFCAAMGIPGLSKSE